MRWIFRGNKGEGSKLFLRREGMGKAGLSFIDVLWDPHGLFFLLAIGWLVSCLSDFFISAGELGPSAGNFRFCCSWHVASSRSMERETR